MIAAILYFAISLWLLALTAFTLKPSILGRNVQPFVAFVAMIVQWFVPHLLVGGLGLTFLASLSGAFVHPIGQVALGIHLLCWLGLSYYLHRSHTAIPLLDGAPVGDREEPFLFEGEGERPPPRNIAWMPAVTWRTSSMRGVEVTRDVVFREAGGIRLKVDIYRPRARSERPLPVVLYVHGGGWVSGTRRQSRFMMYELAEAGFAVFAISYRLAPRFALPFAIEDVKAALVWVRKHAADYGADGSRIAVAGGSAGGHLAAMLALTPNDPRFQPGFEGEDTSVSGAVILYGAAEITRVFEEEPHATLARLIEKIVFQRPFSADPELYRRSQPISHVRPDAPPILLVHGTLDLVVPFEVSRRFADALRKAQAREVHLLEMPHAHHAFELFPTPAEQRAVRVIARFLRWVDHAPDDRPMIEPATSEATAPK